MPEPAWTSRYDPLSYRPPILAGGRARGPGLGETAGEQTPDQLLEPMKLKTVAVRVEGDSDALVKKKVQLLREFVVAPALATGSMGMAFTRSLLTEALGRAPKELNSHQKSPLAVRIFEFVRSRIRYVNDPVGQEYFQSVPGIWKAQMGDCEDFTALLAALFTAAGIKVQARVIRIPSAEGWAHIYPMAWLDGAWRAFDATERWPAGWQYPKRTAELDLPIAPEMN